VIVLGTGLTVSSHASFAFCTETKQIDCASFHRIYLSHVSSHVPRSESLLHPCVLETLEECYKKKKTLQNIYTSTCVCMTGSTALRLGVKTYICVLYCSHSRLSVVLHPVASFRRNPSVSWSSLHRQASIRRLAQA